MKFLFLPRDLAGKLTAQDSLNKLMSVKIGSPYWISIILVVGGWERMGFQYNHMIYYGWLICIWCWGYFYTAPITSIIFPWPQAGSQEAAEDTDPHKHLTLHWAVIRGDEKLLQQLLLGVVKVKKCGTACLQLALSDEISCLCYGKGCKIWFGGCKKDRWRAGCQLSSELWNMRIDQISGLPACRRSSRGVS